MHCRVQRRGITETPTMAIPKKIGDREKAPSHSSDT